MCRYACGPHRGKMDRRLRGGVRALRGEARRHGGDPLRDAVAPAQRAARRACAAAARRKAVPHRGADAAQPASGAGALDRCERGDRRAGAGGERARCCGLRGRLHHRGPDACARDARDPESRRAHPGDLQRASRGARTHGARRCAGSACPRRRESAARRETHDGDVAGRQQSRRGHDRRADGRHLGLDREARHARALAGRHRGELPEVGRRERHAGARPRRRQSHLQALSRSAGAAHARERLRDQDRRRGDGRGAVPLVSGGVGRQERLCGLACRLRAQSEGALRGADDVRPARHQRHRDPRGRGQLPVLHRRERVRRPLHGGALRPAGDAHHDHGGWERWW